MAKYSEEKLIEEIYRVSEEHCDGKRPSIRIMNIHSDISICRYREQFGKWNNAIKETDFQPHAKGEAKYKNKEDVRRALKNGSKKYCGGNVLVQNKLKNLMGFLLMLVESFLVVWQML